MGVAAVFTRVDRVEDQLGLGRLHDEHDQGDPDQDDGDGTERHEEQPSGIEVLPAGSFDPEGATVDGHLGDGLVVAADLVERAPGGGVADQLPVAEVEGAVRDPAQFSVERVPQQRLLDR